MICHDEPYPVKRKHQRSLERYRGHTICEANAWTGALTGIGLTAPTRTINGSSPTLGLVVVPVGPAPTLLFPPASTFHTANPQMAAGAWDSAVGKGGGKREDPRRRRGAHRVFVSCLGMQFSIMVAMPIGVTAPRNA
jgi:hypothetical protein